MKTKYEPTCLYEVINPKAVTAEELFGHMDAAKEWCDGVRVWG